MEVTLLAGYPKQDKLEQIIKHGVELGAAHVVPFFSRHCVAAPKKEEQKNERYNRIALEAAKQCGREMCIRDRGKALGLAGQDHTQRLELPGGKVAAHFLQIHVGQLAGGQQPPGKGLSLIHI